MLQVQTTRLYLLTSESTANKTRLLLDFFIEKRNGNILMTNSIIVNLSEFITKLIGSQAFG